VQLGASQDAKETQSVAEALVNQWGAIGIKVNMKVIDSQTWTDTQAAGTWDLYAFRGGQDFALPFTHPNALAPVGNNFNWHKDTPDKPREMMDFEKQLVDIVTKYKSTFDAAERKSLLVEYNNIFTQNVYDMGVFVGRYGLGTGKRFKNIADGTPVFMYTWVEGAIMLDQVWTPKADQLPENRPDTIPVYSN
jgi:peptide/nickel transport system substrate-binding protein